MSKLEFIHDQFLFDNLPVEKLNSVQKGRLDDFLNDLPEVDELEELYQIRDKSENIENLLNAELKYIKSKAGKNELLNYTTKDLLQYYRDFIEQLLYDYD